jgi:hypothetical protein
MNIQAPPPRASDPAPMRLVYPPDTVGKAIVYGLEEPTEPPRHGILKRAIGQQGPAVGWWLVGLWFVLFTFVALFVSIFTDNGSAKTWAVTFAIDSVILQAFLLFLIWFARHTTQRFPEGVKDAGEVSVRSLRQAALAGNDELAPAATTPIDDEAFATPLTTTATETLAVLPPDWRLLRGVKILSGVCIGIVVLLGAMLWVMDKNTSAFPWDVVTIVPFGIMICFWALLHCIRRSRAFQVTIGADGLRWRKRTLPWSEVRGWYVLYLHPLNTSWTHPNTVYALIGQHASLTWLTYPQPVDSDDPGKRLAQLVQARLYEHRQGSLPLRNLTPGAVTISYEVGSRLLWWRIWRLEATNSHSLRGSPLPRLPAALVTFFLAVLALVGVILTPNAQQWYFGGQLTQLEAASTALHDPLTANTLQWKTAPVYGNHSTFAFTPQGYTYPAEECCGASSLAAQSVSDGLVEMTVRQQTTDAFDGAGIVFRANSHARIAFVFIVTPDGDWRLDRYTLRSDGTFAESDLLRTDNEIFGVSAIHQGHDVTNQLAVLMQGSSLTFFINGQFVGRYWNTDPPQSGQVGVYANGYENTVTFSNLLIAPS